MLSETTIGLLKYQAAYALNTDLDESAEDFPTEVKDG
jgi:hypothetical protein